MKASPKIDDNAVAEAAYAAMCAPPPHVALAQSLAAARSVKARTKLLDAAKPATRAAALAYLAEPEATRERSRRLAWMRADKRRIAALRTYYASHVADFISEYAWTTDPRLLATGKPARIPLVLWPRQVELVDFMVGCWQSSTPGTVVKSRDIGGSAVSMAVLGSLCLFHDDFIAGVGSQKESKVDQPNNPSTLMHKLREFLMGVPPEFTGGWSVDKHSAHLRISFPNGSAVIGEAGDAIGRGSRFAIFILDESAHVEHSALVDASLSAATTCRIDISSVRGTNTGFYERAHNSSIPRFDFHWTSDPRKAPGTGWYEKQCAELDPVTLAQEVDMDWHASTKGSIIQSADLMAAIDLHIHLGLPIAGKRVGALDVADEGKDRNAFAVRHGQLLEDVTSWSGKGADLFATTQRAMALCDEHGLDGFTYDADGLGAGIRGDARVINDRRKAEGTPQLRVNEYRGSAAPEFPSARAPRTNRTNQDYFLNRKAQNWHHFAMRLRESAKARRGEPYDPELIVCISSKIAELSRLLSELTQATGKESASGKMMVNKIGDGEKSPNLADAVVIVFGVIRGPMNISASFLEYLR